MSAFFKIPLRSIRFKALLTQLVCGVIGFGAIAVPLSCHVLAQTPDSVPSVADPGRIGQRLELRDRPSERVVLGDETPALFMAVPEGADSIIVTFRDFNIEGGTYFPRQEIEAIYAPFRGRPITLDTLWVIAAQITDKYRQAGFFLSRAFVPEQELDDGGIVSILVVEGSIGEVRFDGDSAAFNRAKNNRIIQEMVDTLISKKPIRTADLESFLLRMNDIAGLNVRGILQRADEVSLDRARLVLLEGEADKKFFVEANNFGSRFLGPHQLLAHYATDIIPFQQTSVTIANSLPLSELNYISVRHAVPIMPKWQANFGGSFVKTKPGENLRNFDLQGETTEFYAGIEYQPIRQRNENLSFFARMSMSQTDTDILNTTFVKDRIRKVEIGVNYDRADRYHGYNIWSGSITQGLDILGARGIDDADISRADARSNFTKLNASYTRQQALPQDIILLGQIDGQIASGSLFSSEEFGFGGQRFGRAYDGSEIVGDHGIALSIEARYRGLSPIMNVKPNPYVFYDIGSVWNDGRNQINQLSAASAGFGVRLRHAESAVFANMGLAFPLTKEANNPIYKQSERSPRFLLQISSQF